MTALRLRVCLPLVAALLLVSQGPAAAQGAGGGGGGVPQQVAALRVELAAALARIANVEAIISAFNPAALAALQAQITAEASARAAADTALQNNINNEAAARVAADTTLQNNIDNEVAARAAADAALQASLDAEAATRAAKDVALQAEIDGITTGGGVPAVLTDLAAHLTLEGGYVNGVAGPNFVFHGANLHIRNDGGATASSNGLGNLIVGYNESIGDDAGRGGSHNLVIGAQHQFTSYGGLVAGFDNKVSNFYASVTGGEGNTASGQKAVVVGGDFNTAGFTWSVLGGGSTRSTDGIARSKTGAAASIAP